MYVLRKGNRILKRSRYLEPCALSLNRRAGFRIIGTWDWIEKRYEYPNTYVWIEYKDYSLKWEGVSR